MMNQLIKKNCVLLLMAIICLAFTVADAAAQDSSNQQLRFERITSGRNDGTFRILSADNISFQALTGNRELTEAESEFLANLPEVQMPAPVSGAEAGGTGWLPLSVNNALNKFFRPIFSQSGGSCGQASGVGYAFTYEINFERNLSAALEANQYPTHYTWNFLNGGAGNGSWYFDGWQIIKDNGCPNIPTFGELNGDDTRWMSGYDNYFKGMQNRVKEIAQITNVNTPAGLTNLKQWLFNHADGSHFGGVGCFAAFIFGADYVILPAGTPQEGKQMLTRWGSDGYHAMTIVGYDDTVRFDFNQDGNFTNNLDINGDGVVTMNDWEKGALLFANSWGTGYGDNGFSYMAYKAIADKDYRGEDALTNNSVHIVRTKPVNRVKMTLKVLMRHDARTKLKISAIATQNSTTFRKEFPKAFDFSGGFHPMRGRNNVEPIELGLDISTLAEQVDLKNCAEFALEVIESDLNNTSTGEIISLSLIDYTGFKPVEFPSSQSNVPIANDTTTVVPITRCPRPHAKLRIHYYSHSTVPYSNTLFINFKIINDGTTPVPLSALGTNYWYTCEGTGQYETAAIDYAGILPSGRNITSTVSKYIQSINQGGQNRCCQISFKTCPDSLQPGESVECKYRVYKSDWSDYTQTNDYSFGTQSSYIDWTKMTAYLNDSLVWGVEP